MKRLLLLYIIALLFIDMGLWAQVSGPDTVALNTTATFTNSNGACGVDCIVYFWVTEGSPTQVSYSQSQIQLSWSKDGFYDVDLWVTDNYGQSSLVDGVTIKVGLPRRIDFSYDQAGNRTQRETVYITSAKKRLSNPDPPKDEEPEFSKELKIYPNPFNDHFFLTLDDVAYEAETKNLLIYDNLGKLVKTVQVYDYVNEITSSELGNGSYIIRLQYGGNSKEWLLIKN